MQTHQRVISNQKKPLDSKESEKKRKEREAQLFLNRVAVALRIKPEILATFSVIFRLIGISFLFFLFQVSFFILYSKIGVYFPEMWLLQILISASYGFFVYGTVFSGKSKGLRIFKTIISLLAFIAFMLLFLAVTIWLPELFSIRLFLLVFAVYYALNCVIQYRLTASPSDGRKTKAVLIMVMIFLSLNGFIYGFSMTSRTVDIKLYTKPEIIFWCASSQLPDDPAILKKCHAYSISFMPTLREKDIGNQEYIDAYKLAVEHKVNLYFALGGNSEFFIHLDNAHELPRIYENIREWFGNEGILESKYVTSFSIDAEPPKAYLEKYEEPNLLGTLGYSTQRYPTEAELENATASLSSFMELVRRDGKKCGIVPCSRYIDGGDSDGDISFLGRNLYALPNKWDFSATMLYRTNRLTYNEEDDLPPEFFLRSMEAFYGAVIEGTKLTTSKLSFYQNVALEQDAEFPKAFRRHIFVGNLKSEFSDTSYIRSKEYFTDIDLCRAFNETKVFLYNLGGFLTNYGWEELDNLYDHIENTDSIQWNYKLYKSITFLSFYCSLVLFDIFASLEKDLL